MKSIDFHDTHESKCSAIRVQYIEAGTFDPQIAIDVTWARRLMHSGLLSTPRRSPENECYRYSTRHKWIDPNGDVVHPAEASDHINDEFEDDSENIISSGRNIDDGRNLFRKYSINSRECQYNTNSLIFQCAY